MIIQPGLIKTEFGETAAAGTPSGSGDEAYGHFNATVAQTTREAYEKGLMSKLGAGPEHHFRPPYVGHRGWVGVRLDSGLAWDNVAGALEDADHCVA